MLAFVVVAAVFGFVVLQAGFSSAQRGQSVIHDGIGQAGSSCMVAGIVYGISAAPGFVESIVVPDRPDGRQRADRYRHGLRPVRRPKTQRDRLPERSPGWRLPGTRVLERPGAGEQRRRSPP
ncbi:hypothetical protein [Methanoculleus sp. 10]|uniref:hypothetical protein n=1 Tax=Methanoculleus sp. 10 TaxID=430615 RepID=UPI0025F31E0E|nr:hypothetical protein [Methanoculleus sp. 10]